MKKIILLLVTIAVLCGCASSPTTPELNDVNNPQLQPEVQLAGPGDGPYRLWGEWTFYINEDHTSIDVVPNRQVKLHLNALKFLEEYCFNCLQITGITNNGDGTIDVDIRIKHPFPGLPQYTGFDVKGIIMFEGSRVFERPDKPVKYPLAPQAFRTSWRLLGDPELLNADGYTYRWSPWYESGSELPIFNYWPGKHSNGTPTANINAYMNFYSMEERHIFEHDTTVTRTYHISLPPGPVVVGYAIEACWEPPVNTPVTNPVEDFPISANQSEAYYLKVVIFDGQPITEENPCCGPPGSIHKARVEMDYWYKVPEYDVWDAIGSWCPEIPMGSTGYPIQVCDGPPNWYCMFPYWYYDEPEGIYQYIAFVWYTNDLSPPIYFTSVTLYEVEIYH